MLRTHTFMNIYAIIDNKISYYYFFKFLEQSEHILQLLAFSCVGWFCCAKLRMAHLPFFWFGPNLLGGVKFRLIVWSICLMTNGVLATSY